MQRPVTYWQKLAFAFCRHSYVICNILYEHTAVNIFKVFFKNGSLTFLYAVDSYGYPLLRIPIQCRYYALLANAAALRDDAAHLFVCLFFVCLSVALNATQKRSFLKK